MKNKLSVLHFVLTNIIRLDRAYLFIQGCLAFFNIIIIFYGIYLPSMILEVLRRNENFENAALEMLVLLIIILVMKIIYQYFNQKSLIKSDLLTHLIIKDICENLLYSPYQDTENPSYIDKVSSAIEPIDNLKAITELLNSLPRIIQYIIAIVGIMLIIADYELKIIFIITMISIIQLFVNICGIYAETKLSKKTLKYSKEYWYYLKTTKEPIIAKDVRIYRMQHLLLQKIDNLFEKFVKNGIRKYHSISLRELLSKVISIILLIFIYLNILGNTVNSSISPSKIILIINSTTTLFMIVNKIQEELLKSNQQLDYLKGWYDFYKTVNNKYDSSKLELKDAITSIEFKNVTFSYPNTSNKVIDALNLKIDNKENIAIVGKNGSGKSTLIKLLARFYEPSSGEILVNGININNYTYQSYIKHISFIFQDFKIFNYPIKENITFDDLDLYKYNYAIKKSKLDCEFIKFSKGDATFVGKLFEEDGVILSKGQEQKVAIARSIYKQSDFIIMDEPTASLDPLAEAEVFEHFNSITKDKLSIMISHRLSSCKISDKIILIDNGIISEMGTHIELMKKKGLYYEMYQTQKNNYE